MAFRRRSARGGSRSGGGGGSGRRGRGGRGPQQRLLDKLRAHKPLGLRDVSPLERPKGTPDDIELATARRRDRRVAVVASRHDGPELLGWGRLAARLADAPVEEVLLACPLFGTATRRLLDAPPDGPPLRLVSVPALSDSPEALLEEQHPEDPAAWRPTSPALLDRVLRVVEGAAIASDAGALRPTSDACVLYLRGVRALEIRSEGDGIGVQCLEPERRQLHVSESNLASRAPELWQLVASLAGDPRLLETEEARRDAASESLAAAVGARITARWLPCTADGSDPVDWVGIDESGRAIVGLQRAALGMADASAILTACLRVGAERALWAPASAGRVRVVIACDDVDAAVLELLESLDVDVEARPLANLAGEDSGERRGRRRGRRRRRPRGDEPRPAEAREDQRRDGYAGEPRDEDAAEARDEYAGEPRDEHAGEPPDTYAGEPRDEQASEAALSEAGADDAPRGRSRRGRRRRPAGDADTQSSESSELPDPQEAPPRLEEGVADAQLADASEGAEALDRLPESDAAAQADERDAEEVPDVDPVSLEIEATLVEEQPEEEEGDEPEPVEREKPRVRRQRAALAVHNDADSILAALVLARERRHIVFFYVCGQDELMDFFRGKATDVDDNSDLLLVGFNAAPLPRETIATAELYRGRLQWFDHHPWAIEDLEALRDAIGSDSIAVAEAAASPLVPIMEVVERRSRFTDKLVDLSARRLSENDMDKWGYRVIALVERMRGHSGDYRNDISPILSGKPADLPEGEGTYAAEAAWLEEHDPRLIHFGEYQMAVLQVPDALDAGEVARRARIKTGARLSLSARGGDTTVLLACNDEKRHINVMGMVEALASRHAWTQATPGGDRVGRLRVEDLGDHPERMEALIGDIVRHKSILYG